MDAFRQLVDRGLRNDGSAVEDARQSTTPNSAGDPAPRTYLVRVERPAMACSFEVYLNAGEFPGAEEVALGGLDLIAELEEQLSIYRPASEITRLNRVAHREPVPVEPRLFGLLGLALDVYRATGHAFDITSGVLSTLWGFDRRSGRVPSDAEIEVALAYVGSCHVWLEPDHQTVQFAIPGLQINLGGIGKGYALDRCSEYLLAAGCDSYLLHGGQSSVLAHGRRMGQDGFWLVAIRHPQRPEQILAEIRLVNQALGTSGTATQSFYQGGRRYGHILDPRSGYPVDGDIYSVSAVASTAAEADALATAFFVLGPTATAEYCQQHSDVGAIFVRAADRFGSVDVELFGSLNSDGVLIRHPSAAFVQR